MKIFLNLNVKIKLILVFSVICIFMILIGIEGILSSAKINEGSKAIYGTNLISIKDLEEIKGNLNDIGANTLRIVFERDKSKLDEQIKNITDLTNEDIILQNEYEALPSTSEEDKLYADFKTDLVKYREQRTKVIEFAKANNYEDAVNSYNSEMSVTRISMAEKLGKCIEINVKSAEQSNLNNLNDFNKSRNTIILYTSITFLIILFMAYILSKNIMNPLNKIKDLANRLSHYDFSDTMTVIGKDEFAQTAIALNTA